VSGSGDPSIQGFTTDISYNRGQPVSFKIKTDATAYRLDLYRMGYYSGKGARKVATVNGQVIKQPNCKVDAATGLIDCGNWSVTASWLIPSTATSGIYFARLVRPDTGGASHVFFVVRDDSSHSHLLVQTSDTTWQAYNEYGGNSLYVGQPVGRAYKVSYNRPLVWRSGGAFSGVSNVFNDEYPMVRWLEANGYDVSYFSGVDSDRSGGNVQNHKVFLSVGHDEYWSSTQRANVEAALAAGVNLAYFSGNEIFWKIRWENSIDGLNTEYRTAVCYKETHANQPIDPLDPPTWTGTWRDPRFSPPADGGRPENALTGTIFTVNGIQFNDLTVSGDYGRMRFWRNTDLATLPLLSPPATLGTSVLGYEWDEDLDNGFRPRGLIRLSSTTADVNGRLLDYGSSYGPGPATHHLTLYRHNSGALVFGAGTVQWSWGLDANHDNNAGALTSGPDVRMQQATVNLFADMGVQPASLQPLLVSTTASVDTQAPTSQITSPSSAATVESGSAVTIAGTASDTGGVVGGVEVSVDDGTGWHPATGRESWSYTWVPTVLGPATIRSTAVDDSGNLESPGAAITVQVASSSGPTRIWSDAVVPATTSANDPNPVELGVKFISDVSGSITGLHFYKGNGNIAPHFGHLWLGDGTLLATATFENETASGWQQANFPSPVPINANTTYVVSYHTDVGQYAFNSLYFFASGVDSPPLHALRDGVDGPNGVYAYGGSGFPLFGFQSANYWIDVDFTPDQNAPSAAVSSAEPKQDAKPSKPSKLKYPLSAWRTRGRGQEGDDQDRDGKHEAWNPLKPGARGLLNGGNVISPEGR
jgi:hypothetical protein